MNQLGTLVSGERITLTRSALVADDQADPRSEGWLADNVWHPFVNGTGVKQIYNNFASEKLLPEYVAPAKTFSPDWAVQSLSSAGGAILTYSLVGKAAGLGLSNLGGSLGMEGAAARFLASETTAQIVGAGLYDFAKAPNQGETRLGNAAGSVAAFGLFSAGNSLLAGSKTIAESSLYTGLGRVAVGAAGGLTSLETSHFVSKLMGVNNKVSWDDRFKAMANGGFVNVALPPLQKGITTVIDYSINGQPWGKGIPIERYLQYSKDAVENRIADLQENSPGASEKIGTLKEQLAALGDPLLTQLGRENPFARVKVLSAAEDSGSRADMSKNRVEFNESDGAGKLAHELEHLQMAKTAEPFYNEVGKLIKTDPLQAEAKYYALRANMESAARMAENAVLANQEGTTPVIDNPLHMGEQVASNGITYFENWQSEFRQLQANPKYRPSFEYSEAKGATAALLEAAKQPAPGPIKCNEGESHYQWRPIKFNEGESHYQWRTIKFDEGESHYQWRGAEPSIVGDKANSVSEDGMLSIEAPGSGEIRSGVLKSWSRYTPDERADWLNHFEQIHPVERDGIVLAELGNQKAHSWDRDLKAEAIKCIPMLAADLQHDAWVRAVSAGRLEDALSVVHQLDPSARSEVQSDIRKLDLYSDAAMPLKHCDIDQHRLSVPREVTAAIRRDFGSTEADSSDPTTYRAHEYTVTGHSARLLIDAIRDNRYSLGVYPEDIVELMDQMPDRRLVKSIGIPSIVAQRTHLQSNLNGVVGEANIDGSIHLFNTFDQSIIQFNRDFRAVFFHEWSHQLLFDAWGQNDLLPPEAFQTAVELEKAEWNSRPYANKNLDEQFAVHMGEGLLGDRTRFYATAWSAPIRSAVMGKMLADRLATLPPEMQSSMHGEWQWRLDYLHDHIQPEAVRLVAEQIPSGDINDLSVQYSQSNHLRLLSYLKGDQSIVAPQVKVK